MQVTLNTSSNSDHGTRNQIWQYYGLFFISRVYSCLLVLLGKKSHFPAETLNLHCPGKTGGWVPGGGKGHEGGGLASYVSRS